MHEPCSPPHLNNGHRHRPRPQALERARARLADFEGRFQAIQANFADLNAVLNRWVSKKQGE